MPKQSKFQVTETSEELKSLHSKLKNYREKLRVKSLILFKTKKFKTHRSLADHLGVSLSTLTTWFTQYKREGLQSFASHKAKGHRKSAITTEMKKFLRNKLHNATEPFKSFREAAESLNEVFKQDVSYEVIRRYIHKHHQGKLKVARQSHCQKDEEAIAAFLKTSDHTK